MFTPKTQIAFALTSLVVCILIVTKSVGLVPNRAQTITNARGKLCESIALGGSALLSSTKNIRAFEALLKSVVERNPQLLSAGLRRTSTVDASHVVGGSESDSESHCTDSSVTKSDLAKSDYIIATEGHAKQWMLPDGNLSTDEFMYVPLLDATNNWGQLELCFVSIRGGQFGDFIDPDAGGMILFAGPLCFLMFSFVLGIMLKQLDPSGAVPKRVTEALDSLAEGLLIVDTRDRVLMANQAFAGVLGVMPKKLIGKPASQFRWLVDGESKPVNLPWQQALELKRPLSNCWLQLIGKDNEIRSFSVNASPIVAGQDGNYRGVLVTFDDVTVLEKHKAELGVAKEAAESANRAKSQFLANMSHEIRTPINAILGFTDVLRRGMETDEAKRLNYLHTIYSSGSHLIELINDILDLSKIEAGKLELEIAPASPYQIMCEVVDVLQVRAEQSGISLRSEVDGLIPTMIRTDATRLRQILMNLIGNAIKFTEQGGVIVVCRLVGNQSIGSGRNRMDPLSSCLEYVVVDTGMGMSPEQCERIFNPFEQADASVTRRFGGTGLGLSISKRFADALGGSIQVHSEVGKGSAFTVRVGTGSLDGIEMQDENTARAAIESHRHICSTMSNSLLPCSGSVLLVDDGESNREFVSIVIRKLGLEVTEAENGQEALHAAAANEFDIILMDMQMPVMDGYSATCELRRRGFGNPIVAMTANSTHEDQKKCESVGCDGFLAKPIDIDHLVQLLHERLGQSEDGVSECIEPAANSVEAVQADNFPSLGKTSGENDVVLDLEVASELIFSTLPTEDSDFRMIVRKFMETLPAKIENMCDAWDSQDFHELENLAHWLKGAGGTVGFGCFTEPAIQLEQAAKHEKTDAVGVLLGRIIDIARLIRLDTKMECAVQ